MSSGEGGINHCARLNGLVQLCRKRCLLSTAQIMKIPHAEAAEMSRRSTDGAFVPVRELRLTPGSIKDAEPCSEAKRLILLSK